MVNEKETSGGLELKANVIDGSSKISVPESGPIRSTWLGLAGLVLRLISKVRKFFEKAWSVGVDDPRKVIHCFKVGLALTVVSLFYYMRPLHQGLGGNAMWAVLTVVVVFEYTVGATLYKSLNRAAGTLLAGALAVGVHWFASQSGETFEAIILRTSVFLLASAATFSRFIPVVKARFDYGAMIFILTFSLVSVSAYRVDKLFDLAHQRFSTVAIGIFMCVLIGILICPVWAGQDLHLLIVRNMEKIANSLDGCVSEYYSSTVIDDDEEYSKKIKGYKCVLNSKGSEESLANLARWEPPHGRFSFRHPWNQYLKIGSLIRNCAYCIEALNGCIYSEIQAHELIKKHLSSHCMRLSSNSSTVLKELAVITKTMKKSSTIDVSVAEMNSAVQDLQNALKMNFLPTQLIPSLLTSVEETRDLILTMATTSVPVLLEVLPLVTVTSLLIEISARIGEIVYAVEELASMTGFTKPAGDENKNRQNKPVNSDDKGVVQETMKALQQV
ncbi:Aluminum-activated malate transporter [Macleaya cordata]|uniref:Aluminum-activated malate transporter n=1 Tax=Macleaya cordata TaxID=56857 RepID=A0A200QWA3_MACCD|nr:Aluminum-activated malate transporter [Macleaya cordata]